jgi:Beta-galactosidase
LEETVMKRYAVILLVVGCVWVGTSMRARSADAPANAPQPDSTKLLNSGQGTPVDPAAVVAEGFKTLDLRGIVTLNWKDDRASGTKGWTRQGENDMRNVQPGLQKLLGIPFDLIDANSNGGKAVLTLKSNKFPAGAASTTLAVGAKAASIYFLHASAWTRDHMATYVVTYDDGATVEIPIVGKENINDWWVPISPKNARIAMHTFNAQSDDLCLFAFGWDNPSPDKTIKSLEFKTENTDGIVVLTAVTLSDKPVALPDPSAIELPDYLKSDASLMDKTQWFPVEIKDDPFKPTPIDQSVNIDAPAGKHGFEKTVDGRWAFDDGTPCRMVATMTNPPQTRQDAVQQARFLAKYGFTMVRMGHLAPDLIDPNQPDTQHLNAKFLDNLDFFINELAKNGIYTRLSTMWYRKFKEGDNIPGFDQAATKANTPGAVPEVSSMGITFFVPRVEELNIQLEKDLMAHRNPYRDNKPYGEDPAICQYEVTNEDGIFFSTFDGIAPVYSKMLDQMWLDWLTKKYGTEEKLAAAWGDGWRSADSLVKGHVNRRKLYQFEATPGPASAPRVHDQLEFYASLENGYFTKTREALRAQGMHQPICGSGWFGAGNTFFTDIYANAKGMDYIDRHHYWGGGPGDWQILELPFDPACALQRPELILKLGQERVIGMPFTISEWANTLPNQYRLEAPGLMAFYGNELGGWDAPIHFAWGAERGEFCSFLKWMWPVNEASTLCQYPALSQMIRDADIQPGPDAYIRNMSDNRVLSGQSTKDVAINLSISGPFEALAKQSGQNPKSLAAIYAAAVGRTGVAFTGDVEKPDYSIDLDKYLDMDKKEIHSATGELYWNYGVGYVTANAPKMQGVVGFCTDIPIALKDCQIQASNKICSVLVSPVDGKPLSESKHILITAVGRCRNTDMAYTRGGASLLHVGTSPTMLEGVKGTVTLHRTGACTVAGLDIYGYKDCDVTPTVNGGDIVIPMDGQNKAAYYEITFQ